MSVRAAMANIPLPKRPPEMPPAGLEPATRCLEGASRCCGLLPPATQTARRTTVPCSCCALLRFAASKPLPDEASALGLRCPFPAEAIAGQLGDHYRSSSGAAVIWRCTESAPTHTKAEALCQARPDTSFSSKSGAGAVSRPTARPSPAERSRGSRWPHRSCSACRTGPATQPGAQPRGRWLPPPRMRSLSARSSS